MKKRNKILLVGGLAVAAIAVAVMVKRSKGSVPASIAPMTTGSGAGSSAAGGAGAKPGKILTPGVNTAATGYDGSGINPAAGRPADPASVTPTTSLPVVTKPASSPTTTPVTASTTVPRMTFMATGQSRGLRSDMTFYGVPGQ